MADAFDQDGRGSELVGNASLSDRSLILRLRDHQQDAWNEMVHIYYPVVYAWCRRDGLQGNDVLDVIQEVFGAVARSLGEFRVAKTGDTFRGWLRGIARHKLLDFHRRSKKQEQAAGGSGHTNRMATVPDPLDDATDEQSIEVAAAVHRALELIRREFAPRTWQAFWQVQMEDQTPSETAAGLQISVNAVYKAKARVLQRLRSQLGDFQE